MLTNRLHRIVVTAWLCMCLALNLVQPVYGATAKDAASADNGAAAGQDQTIRTDGYSNGTSGTDLSRIGQYVSGSSNKDGGVAEIVSYDNENNKAWVVNGATGKLDILDLADVTCNVSQKITAESIDIKALTENETAGFNYGDTTSVAVDAKSGLAAVAIQADDYDKNGYVAFFSAEKGTYGRLLAMIEAGCQPDMVCFSPDGSRVLTANEGEPRNGFADGAVDPKGSVTVITVNKDDYRNSKAADADFSSFDSRRDELVRDGVMMVRDAMPSVDLEPEYIACSGGMAYVTLQEANAVGVLDIEKAEFTGVYSLGYKDLSLEKNAIDLIDDGKYDAKTYDSAVGAYMPDGISAYEKDGKTYLITANEGDARDWGSGDNAYSNEVKVTLTAADGTKAKKVRTVDPEVTDGTPEGKNVLFGGRSFSIYEADSSGLTQVYDSGSEFESKTSEFIPEYFNCSNDDNIIDSRSQKKGPEPEGTAVGTVDGKTYAFIGLERIGGIMMYDITDPDSVKYTNYINSRDFAEDPENAAPGVTMNGDVAPEGLCFISAEESPSGTPILLSAFEVSGTVAAYAVGSAPAGHKLHTKTVKATLSKDGSVTISCSICGKTTEKKTIYRPYRFTLSSGSYSYDGRTHKPSVSVKDKKGRTVDHASYSISYSKGRKNVGTYKVTVKFKGDYSGSKILEFRINPPKTYVTKLSKQKKAFTVKWKKKTSQITGYQIRYSTKSSMSGSKTVTVKSYKQTSKKISRLSSGRKYHVQVRTYKKSGKMTYYSGWSAIKTVKTR